MLHPEAQLQLHCVHPQGAASTAPRFDPVRRCSITPSLRQALQLHCCISCHRTTEVSCSWQRSRSSRISLVSSASADSTRNSSKQEKTTATRGCYEQGRRWKKYTCLERSNANRQPSLEPACSSSAACFSVSSCRLRSFRVTAVHLILSPVCRSSVKESNVCIFSRCTCWMYMQYCISVSVDVYRIDHVHIVSILIQETTAQYRYMQILSGHGN